MCVASLKRTSYRSKPEHYHSDNERQLRLEQTSETADRETDGLSRSAVIGGPALSSLRILRTGLKATSRDYMKITVT